MPSVLFLTVILSVLNNLHIIPHLSHLELSVSLSGGGELAQLAIIFSCAAIHFPAVDNLQHH